MSFDNDKYMMTLRSIFCIERVL